MDTSGSRKVVPGRAVTRPAKAGNSMPAPTQLPCTRASTRAETWCSSRPAPALVRTK
jgi:hypothetical protein